MSSRRPLWSERHAVRDMCVLFVISIGFVFAMAVAVIVLSHAWTAGSVAAASR